LEISNGTTQNLTLTSDGFARAILPLKALKSLQINGDRTTDDWLPAIAQLKTVDYLMLTYAQVTDQGLTPLMKLPLWVPAP